MLTTNIFNSALTKSWLWLLAPTYILLCCSDTPTPVKPINSSDWGISAGNDTSVGLNDTLSLHFDITNDPSNLSYYWKIGLSPWFQVSSKDTFTIAPSVPSVFSCSLMVSDEDGNIHYDNKKVTTLSSPPFVNAGADRCSHFNDTVFLSGVSFDNGTVVSYHWKLGNGPWLKTISVDTFLIFDTYQSNVACSLRVVDDDGESSSDGLMVSYSLEPAQAGADTTVGLNDTIHLSVFLANPASRLSFYWKVDSSAWFQCGSLDTFLIAPSAPSVFYCSLKVANDNGYLQYDCKKVTILSSPPLLNLGSRIYAHLNDTVFLSGNISDNGQITNYFWKFDNGTWIKTSSADTFLISRTYQSSVTCSLMVVDDDGESAADGLLILYNLEPVNAGTDTMVGLNDTVPLFSYLGHSASNLIFYWKIDSSPWFQTSSQDTFFIAPSAPAVLNCSLKVANNEGLFEYDSRKITVISSPPFINAGTNVHAAFNDTVFLSGTISDNGSILSYYWKFNENPWMQTSSADTFLFFDTYQSNFICSLKAVDEDGESATDGLAIIYNTEFIDAGKDTAVGLNDTVILSSLLSKPAARLSYFWKIGSSGWFQTNSLDTFIIAPSIPAVINCSLKVTNENNFLQYDCKTVSVVSSPPSVNTGSDRYARFNDTIFLAGTASDNGTIADYYWKFNEGPWIRTSSADTFFLFDVYQADAVCSLRVVDDDGETASDGLVIIYDFGTVQNPNKIFSPNSGGIYFAESPALIQWNLEIAPDTLKIQYLTDTGWVWISTVTSDNHELSWIVPCDHIGKSSIRITNTFNSVLAQSDFFKISIPVSYKISSLSYNDIPWTYGDTTTSLDTNFISDDSGIIMYKRGDSLYYHPVQISKQVLKYLDAYTQTNNPEYISRSDQFLKKLLSLAKRYNGAIFFPYTFDFPLHGIDTELMKAPWYSGMAQGQVMACFVRMYYFTGNRTYLDFADSIMTSFGLTKSDVASWTVSYDEEGFFWVEEYPMDACTFTLNGFIFGLYGVYDYYKTTGSAFAEEVFRKSIRTLYNYIPNFRNPGSISYYCLKHKVTSSNYHGIHIEQLITLYKITGLKRFQKYANLFQSDFSGY